jgi:putative cell wall-binding protein
VKHKSLSIIFVLFFSLFTQAGIYQAEEIPDTNPPKEPLLGNYVEGEKELRGMSESLATIIVFAKGQEIGRGTAQSDGFFTISIISQAAGTTLEVIAVDKSNNQSPPATLVVDESVKRIYGENRYLTAVAISNEAFPHGANMVVLVRGDDFPDALAAGPLAYKLGAPILSTPSTLLPEYVKNEITRLGAKNVIIIGGDGAVSIPVETELKVSLGLHVERIAGVNRYDTAAKIADRMGIKDKVVLAYGKGYADALSMSPYAARDGMPILLTETTFIPKETRQVLEKAEITFVVGGEGVISDRVLAQIENGIRISGATRFETNARILELFGSFSNRAVLATGRNYADALTGSVLAARIDSPILLVEKDYVPEPLKNWLTTYGKVNQYKLLGGPEVLSDKMIRTIPTH